MFAVLLLDYIIDYVSKADDSTFHIYVWLTEEKKNLYPKMSLYSITFIFGPSKKNDLGNFFEKVDFNWNQ